MAKNNNKRSWSTDEYVAICTVCNKHPLTERQEDRGICSRCDTVKRKSGNVRRDWNDYSREDD